MRSFVPTSQKQKSLYVQLAIVTCVSFTTIGCGTSISWTSPALPHLKSNISVLPISEFEGSWIASTLSLGGLTGNLVNPVISPFMGRKYCLVISTLLQVISLIMIVFARNVATLYTSRFTNGLANTLSLSFAMMYVGEIAEKDVRGILLLILRASLQSGSLIVLIFGACLPYKIMNLAVLLMPLLYIITFSFIPESPYYLLLQDRKEEARNAVIKLRGTNNPEIIDTELCRIKDTAIKSRDNKRWVLRDLFLLEGNRKAFFILILLHLTKTLSGRLAITAYTQEIFSYSGFSLAPEHSAILYTVVTLITLIIAFLIIDRVGRRKLVLFSAIFSGLGLAIVGLFFFIKFYLKSDVQSITWLPLFGLIFYNVASTLGVGSLTYVITGEIFALYVKVTAVTCSSIFAELLIFLVNVSFEWMNKNFGIHTTFWIYASCCVVGGIVYFFFSPETKGKTLEEIQDILHSNNKNIKNTSSMRKVPRSKQ